MKKNYSCIFRNIICGIIFIVFVAISGCGKHAYYKVAKGDTLYSIGWQYQVDYRTIADWNGIQAPYIIHEGEWIRVIPVGQTKRGKLPVSEPLRKSTPKQRLRPRSSIAKPKPIQKPVTRPKQRSVDQKHIKNPKNTWIWPIKGALLYSFTHDGSHKQGIGISGIKGQAIFSAGAGKVVYSGRGLVGYGNLIIIKHSEVFLSAYAHNERNLVKEGQTVSQGMKIATLGDSGAHRPLLHFEIRKNGKAVNPLLFLPRIK